MNGNVMLQMIVINATEKQLNFFIPTAIHYQSKYTKKYVKNYVHYRSVLHFRSGFLSEKHILNN